MNREEEKGNVINLSSAQRANLVEMFEKCIEGYHFVNDEPLKETMWEEINAQILIHSNCIVNSQSGGSHKSGSDIECSLGRFSNKTTQYEKNKPMFKISSYRLSTYCSDKEPGDIQTILQGIHDKKNFDYYSILVRREIEGGKMQYDWYLIPAEYGPFSPNNYIWKPMIGQRGKKKDVVVGWETNEYEGSSMSITFSMSSQLWLDIHVNESLKKCIIASTVVNLGKVCDYVDIYNMFTPPQGQGQEQDLVKDVVE